MKVAPKEYPLCVNTSCCFRPRWFQHSSSSIQSGPVQSFAAGFLSATHPSLLSASIALGKQASTSHVCYSISKMGIELQMSDSLQLSYFLGWSSLLPASPEDLVLKPGFSCLSPTQATCWTPCCWRTDGRADQIDGLRRAAEFQHFQLRTCCGATATITAPRTRSTIPARM